MWKKITREVKPGRNSECTSALTSGKRNKCIQFLVIKIRLQDERSWHWFQWTQTVLRSPSECCTTQCICPVNHCCLCLPHPIEFEELNVRDCYELRVSVRISTWLKIYILNTFPRIPMMALLDHGASGLTSPQQTLPRKTWDWILGINTLKI